MHTSPTALAQVRGAQALSSSELHRYYNHLFRLPYGCHYDPGNRLARRHVLSCVRTADLALPGVIVDVGSGVADLVEPLVARGVTPERIMLVEYAWRTLQLGRRWLTDANTALSGVRHIQGDAMHLPLRGGAAAVLFCREVLEHLPDDQAALGEFRRVLRPGGLLVLTVPSERRPNPRWGHLRCYTLESLCRRLHETGAWQVEAMACFGRVAGLLWGYPKYALYAAWLLCTGHAQARLQGRSVPSYYATPLHRRLVMPLFDRLFAALASADRTARLLPPSNLLVAARRMPQ
jgi:SAM-dependent methyltransferase